MRNILLHAFMLTAFLACADSSSEKAVNDEHVHATPAEEAVAIPMEPIPPGAKVYFKNLKEGDEITSPYTVEMGVDNMQVDTANGIIKPASGHHHILIGLDSVAAGTVVPKDATHLHFGNAQTSTQLSLQPGNYKLTLQFADALHRSYGATMTQTVNVKVK